MKEIIYKNHKSAANTIYCTTSVSDRQYILDNLKLIKDLDDQMKGTPVSSQINQPNKSLPRQGSGRHNSIRSAADGIVDNMTSGTQRHFSNKTRTLIEQTFREMQSIIPDWETIRWVEESTVAMPTSNGTTLSDLFDIESITITYRKK